MSEKGPRPHEVEIPPSLKEPWREVPDNYISVFHYTDRASLSNIAREGLSHFSERILDSELDYQQRQRISFDTMCDARAKELGVDFLRSKTVFASVDREGEEGNWKTFGDVALEIKVDPSETYIYDRQLYSAAQFAYYRTPEGKSSLENDPETQTGSQNRIEIEAAMKKYPGHYQQYLDQYLKRCLLLSDYLDTEGGKQLTIERPEVALDVILPKNLRISE